MELRHGSHLQADSAGNDGDSKAPVTHLPVSRTAWSAFLDAVKLEPAPCCHRLQEL